MEHKYSTHSEKKPIEKACVILLFSNHFFFGDGIGGKNTAPSYFGLEIEKVMNVWRCQTRVGQFGPLLWTLTSSSSQRELFSLSPATQEPFKVEMPGIVLGTLYAYQILCTTTKLRWVLLPKGMTGVAHLSLKVGLKLTGEQVLLLPLFTLCP